MNPILQAILLGIVEGVTEFLPISSTGHLLVAEQFLGYHDAAKTFTVVIQMGAIFAVLWYYRNDLLKRIAGLATPEGQKFWLNLIVATIPAAVLGLTLDKYLEKFTTITVVALAFLIGGILLWWFEDVRDQNPRTESLEPKFESMTMMQSLQIGLAQCLALVPGVSRSGASIVGGLFTGLNRVTATAFSFYLGLPILGLAGLYKLYKGRDTLSSLPGGSAALLVGIVVSFVVALLVVGWLLRYISRNNFKSFALYRIVAGVVLLAFSLLHII